MIVKLLVRAGLWLALALVLVGSLYHVAWGFSTLSQGDMRMGFVQAVAIDVGLAALTVGIQQRRRAQRPTRRLWAGVLMFAGVSTYANLLYGFGHSSDVVLKDAPVWLAGLRPWLMSAVLPVMVVYLSEIVSENEVAEQESSQTALQPASIVTPVDAAAASGVLPIPDPLSVPKNGHSVAVPN